MITGDERGWHMPPAVQGVLHVHEFGDVPYAADMALNGVGEAPPVLLTGHQLCNHGRCDARRPRAHPEHNRMPRSCDLRPLLTAGLPGVLQTTGFSPKSALTRVIRVSAGGFRLCYSLGHHSLHSAHNSAVAQHTILRAASIRIHSDAYIAQCICTHIRRCVYRSEPAMWWQRARSCVMRCSRGRQGSVRPEERFGLPFAPGVAWWRC